MTFRNDIDVELVSWMGDDWSICDAARVSTLGKDLAERDEKRDAGLINFLMRDRHHTPFEMCNMKFRIRVPLFVLNQHIRHRSVSFNVESSRYTQLDPEFYVPEVTRPLIQTGKVGDYHFEQGSLEMALEARKEIMESSRLSYEAYERLINSGVAREIARSVLPVNVYATAYTSFNLRALMHFLSLRRFTESSSVPTHPQYEIALLAERYEDAFMEKFPVTHAAFVKNGRVC